jgi:hypothetical protein
MPWGAQRAHQQPLERLHALLGQLHDFPAQHGVEFAVDTYIIVQVFKAATLAVGYQEL